MAGEGAVANGGVMIGGDRMPRRSALTWISSVKNIRHKVKAGTPVKVPRSFLEHQS